MIEDDDEVHSARSRRDNNVVPLIESQVSDQATARIVHVGQRTGPFHKEIPKDEIIKLLEKIHISKSEIEFLSAFRPKQAREKVAAKATNERFLRNLSYILQRAEIHLTDEGFPFFASGRNSVQSFAYIWVAQGFKAAGLHMLALSCLFQYRREKRKESRDKKTLDAAAEFLGNKPSPIAKEVMAIIEEFKTGLSADLQAHIFFELIDPVRSRNLALFNGRLKELGVDLVRLDDAVTSISVSQLNAILMILDAKVGNLKMAKENGTVVTDVSTAAEEKKDLRKVLKYYADSVAVIEFIARSNRPLATAIHCAMAETAAVYVAKGETIDTPSIQALSCKLINDFPLKKQPYGPRMLEILDKNIPAGLHGGEARTKIDALLGKPKGKSKTTTTAATTTTTTTTTTPTTTSTSTAPKSQSTTSSRTNKGDRK